MIFWALSGGVIVALTVYAHWNRRIFRKMGVPTGPTWPFLGSFRTYLQIPCLFDADTIHLRTYGADNGKYVGVFDGRMPVLLIGDAEMIRQVVVKQSADFYDRQTYLDEDPSLLSLSLLNLRGAHWKHVRQVLTPTFTPGSLRKMAPLVAKCANHLVDVELAAPVKGDAVDIRDLAGRFTLRTIATIAFGIDLLHSNKKFEDHFVKTTSEIFLYFESMLALFTILTPHVARVCIKVFHWFGIKTSLVKASDELANIISTEISRRKLENVHRDDFLQAMMALEESNQSPKSHDERTGLTRREMIAQCVLFLSAAYETTASSLIFFCLSMAENQDCQERLREELRNHAQHHVGADITSPDALSSLKYLDMCINESMRVYPAVFRTDRVCTNKDGTTLGGIPIPHGLNVGIPIAHMHRLAEFWPEPERFDPERFANGIPPESAFAFLPFGSGPHVCIGERLAKLELRMAIALIFRKYRVQLSEHTHLPVKIGYTGLRTPAEPVYLRFVEAPI